MKLALDLDGPCYDFHRTFRYMMREHRGVVMPPVAEFWTKWDGQTAYGTPEDHAWMWSEGVKRGLFRYGHMITGCRIALEELAKRGHTFHIVTHRPALARDDTWDWCRLFFEDLPVDGLTLLSNGEDKSCIAADILIDDKPENVDQWTDTGRGAVLWCGPWNETWKWAATKNHLIRRAHNWKDVVKYV